jgi:hypothetical protein
MLQAQDESTEAVSILRRAIAIAEQAHGANDPRTDAVREQLEEL